MGRIWLHLRPIKITRVHLFLFETYQFYIVTTFRRSLPDCWILSSNLDWEVQQTKTDSSLTLISAMEPSVSHRQQHGQRHNTNKKWTKTAVKLNFNLWCLWCTMDKIHTDKNWMKRKIAQIKDKRKFHPRWKNQIILFGDGSSCVGILPVIPLLPKMVVFWGPSRNILPSHISFYSYL